MCGRRAARLETPLVVRVVVVVVAEALCRGAEEEPAAAGEEATPGLPQLGLAHWSAGGGYLLSELADDPDPDLFWREWLPPPRDSFELDEGKSGRIQDMEKERR